MQESEFSLIPCSARRDRLLLFLLLENLNLRGGFKASIMDYIKSHYPHLIPLYEKIYLHKDRTYCKQLEQETAKMAQEAQCKYVDNKKYAHSPKEFYSRASSSIGYK